MGGDVAKTEYFPSKLNWMVRVQWQPGPRRYRVQHRIAGCERPGIVHRAKRARAMELKDELLTFVSPTAGFGGGLSPEDAELLALAKQVGVHGLRALLDERAKRSELCADDVIPAYLDYGRLERGWKSRTLRDVRSRLEVFSEAMGQEPLSSLTTNQLKEWRNGFVAGPGASIEEVRSSKRNANNYRGVVHTFFRWIVDEYEVWKHKEDVPTEKVAPFPKVKNPIRIFGLDEVRWLLRQSAGLGVPHRNYLVMNLFLPLRPHDLLGEDRVAGAGALCWRAIDFETGELVLSADEASKERARQIPIPANVLAYLVAHRGADDEPICRKKSNTLVSGWAQGKKSERYEYEQLEGSKIVWQQDILRHTCISMMMAETEGDYSRVARYAGNSESKIRSDYEVVRPHREGVEFFGMDILGLVGECDGGNVVPFRAEGLDSGQECAEKDAI